jgi:hypothetical protein
LTRTKSGPLTTCPVVAAAHNSQEIGNWGVFLPQIYSLYRVVTDTTRNPFTDLSVSGTKREARYRYIL